MTDKYIKQDIRDLFSGKKTDKTDYGKKLSELTFQDVHAPVEDPEVQCPECGKRIRYSEAVMHEGKCFTCVDLGTE